MRDLQAGLDDLQVKLDVINALGVSGWCQKREKSR